MAAEPPHSEENVTAELRAMALGLDPREIGLAPSIEHPRVFGVLMDLGFTEGTAMLLALLDGTVSMYFSTGGGIIGGGEHEQVRRAAAGFIGSAEASIQSATATQEYPLPRAGAVRFYILTYDGVLTAEASEVDLAAGRHAMSGLYGSGQAVITELRLIETRPQ